MKITDEQIREAWNKAIAETTLGFAKGMINQMNNPTAEELVEELKCQT